MADNTAGTDITYDAFVIYNHEDLEQLKFVKKMADSLEGPNHNLCLFIPGRDDAPNHSKFIATDGTVKKTCRRLLVIYSRSTEKCPAHASQLDRFLNTLPVLSITRFRCVIPLIMEECQIPFPLKCLKGIKYHKEPNSERVWLTVDHALRDKPHQPITFGSGPDVDVSDILSDNSGEAHRQWWLEADGLKPLER